MRNLHPVGSPKIGKSFFEPAAYHIATGTPLWGYEVRKGTSCLLLRTNFPIAEPIKSDVCVDSVDGFHIAVQSKTINEGLINQLEEFAASPDTRLIIVDTLQKVREVGNESYSYAADYQTITTLKSFTNKHNLTILVVYHTRKMEASDSFDMTPHKRSA